MDHRILKDALKSTVKLVKTAKDIQWDLFRKWSPDCKHSNNSSRGWGTIA